MKKFLIFFSAFILLVVIVLAVAPSFYKDDIKALIDKELAKTVDADILFDIDKFSLSLLSNFPSVTASVEQFGIIGRKKFAGELLFAVNKLEVEVDLFKILFDDQVRIQGIYLNQPQIFIKVLEDGTANYDIMIESEEATEEAAPEAEEDFQIGIDHWELQEGHIIYDDATLATYLELKELDHTGKGDFSLTVFDLETSTSTYLEHVSYDGTEYLAGRTASLDMVLNMDLDKMRFTFQENRLAINEVGLGLNGWFEMPDEDIDMDLTFHALNNDFKEVVSLIPAIYAKDFEELEANGSFSLEGSIQGTYNENTLPAFQVAMNIENGEFGYPELPEKVANVQMDLSIENSDGVIENTSVTLSRFHMDFGPNPVDATLSLGNLSTYPVKASLDANLNLANISKIYPVEGLSMSGNLVAKMSAEGMYDSTANQIPKVRGTFSLTDGLIDYQEAPTPIRALNINASLLNSTGAMDDFSFNISNFSAEVEGSPIKGSLQVESLDNPVWDGHLEGRFDFDELFPVINKIYPMPGTTIGGVIEANATFKGDLASVEAEQYSKLKNSGGASFDNFSYRDSLMLPQGMYIKSGEMKFDPASILVSRVQIVSGSSDFNLSGKINNYLNYALLENALLEGQMTLASEYINVNEWMPEDTGEEVITTEDEESYAVIEVPQNIDLIFDATIKKIKYENIDLDNAKGTIIVKDGVLRLDGLRTNVFGGQVTFAGTYDTRDIDKPKFDMGLKVAEISISESYAALGMVQALAPIAKHINGKLTTDFKMNGLLDDEMMPDLTTLSGSGLMRIAEAILGNPKLVQGLSKFTASNNASDQTMTFKDILMTAEIQDGKFSVDPFDVKVNGYQANIAGTTGLDGSIDYNIKMDVPAAVVGAQVNAMMATLTGRDPNETIKINLNLGGTYDNPVVSFLGAEGKEQVKTAAKEQALNILSGTGNEKIADSIANTDISKEALNQEIARQKAKADSLAQAQKDSLERAAKAKLEEEKKKALEEAANKLNSLFKKKKNNK